MVAALVYPKSPAPLEVDCTKSFLTVWPCPSKEPVKRLAEVLVLAMGVQLWNARSMSLSRRPLILTVPALTVCANHASSAPVLIC